MMLLVLKAAISVLIFAIGLSVTMADVSYVWRRPVVLAKSLLAMYVVVPLIAILMTRVVDLPFGTEVALVVLAICAGAPLLPKKIAKIGGNPTYMFSLIATTSVLAVITVPLGLSLLTRFVPFEANIVPSEIAATIVKAFLLPLGAGMLTRAILPGLAERFSDPLLQWAGIALALCTVVLLVFGFHLVVDVGLPSLLAFAAFTVLALATGHVLGGPDEGDRTALAVACASRHIGLALLVAANYRGERALELVAGYLVASAVVSLPYVRWRSKVHSDRPSRTVVEP
jgi:predicted Na+-dependent transporter